MKPLKVTGKMMLLLGLMLCAWAGPTQSRADQVDDHTVDRYQQQWGPLEHEAHTAEQQAALARELLAAVDAAEERPMKMLLCRKAYELGSRDLSGYATAATALDRLQRLDPSTRMECLEGLRLLYDRAYKARPKKLRLGTGLAEVLREMAEQRAETTAAEFDAGQINAREAANAYLTSTRELRDAISVTQRVIGRAERDLRTLARHAPHQAEPFEAFVAEFEPQLAELIELHKRISRRQQTFARLDVSQKRFTEHLDEPAAQNVASLCVVALDRPEIVGARVLEHLPGSMAEPIRLASRHPDTLDSVQADRLARWYVSLASGDASETDEHRRAMYARARLYRALADGRGHGASEATLKQINAAIADLGVEQPQTLSAVLAARLDYQLPRTAPDRAEVARDDSPPDADDPADAGADADQPAPQDPAGQTAGDPGQAQPDRDPQPDDADNPDPRRPSPSTGRPSASPDAQGENNVVVMGGGGRPMTLCERCGRKFFAGWDEQDQATLCGRCKSGHRNIFDMDH